MRAKGLVTASSVTIFALVAACSSTATNEATTGTRAEAPTPSASVARSEECALLDASEVNSMVGGTGKLTAAKNLAGGCQWEVDNGVAGVALVKSKSERGLADARSSRETVKLDGGTLYIREQSDEETCAADVVGDNAPPNEFLELTIVATADGAVAMTGTPRSSVCSNAVPQMQKVLRELGWTR